MQVSVGNDETSLQVLSARSARTLYNVADAWGVETPSAIEALGPAVARLLRHRGVSAARRTWASLAWIEWRDSWSSPRWRGFSRQTRAQRKELLKGLEAGQGAAAVRFVRALIEESVGSESASR